MFAVLGLLVLAACSGSGAGSDDASTTTGAAPAVTAPATAAPTPPPAAPTSTTLPEWSDAITRPFLADCAAVAEASDCRCVLDGARATMSSERFVSLAAELSRSGEVGDELRAIAATCGAAG